MKYVRIHIYAFEPDRKAYEHLKHRVNNKNISIYNYGLSNVSGTKSFFNRIDSIGGEHSSLYKEVITDLHHVEYVEDKLDFITIDQFVKENDIKHIDLLKIDVEGHELAVLEGAKETLKKGIISAIQFEFNEMFVVSRVFFKDFIKILPGFSFYRLLPDGMIKFESYTPILHEIFAF